MTVALLATAAAVAICYIWLDRPIATWVHLHIAQARSSGLLEPLTHYPNPLIALSAAAYVSVLIAALAWKVSRFWRVVIVCSISAVMGELIKNKQKKNKNKTKPKTWKNN